jgi:hypothetical protein
MINMTFHNPPLILTLALEPGAFQFFNELRQKHFPADRNFIDAHLTLFHALPNEPAINHTIKELSCRVMPFTLDVVEPTSIGNGVAYKIASRELMGIHKALQDKWIDLLSRQDRQKLWPHITVQNKAGFMEAQRLLQQLKMGFTPFSAAATGLQLWEYLNGPWKLVEHFTFPHSPA